MNIYKEIKRGDIITDKDHIDYLYYTGCNNGKIWWFYQGEVGEDPYILKIDYNKMIALISTELKKYHKAKRKRLPRTP